MSSRRSVLLIFFLNITCLVYPQPGNKPLFEKVSPKNSGIRFKNTLTETDTRNMLSFINFYTGAGVGILDVNNDGLWNVGNTLFYLLWKRHTLRDYLKNKSNSCLFHEMIIRLALRQ
jgi:hypothetical protein